MTAVDTNILVYAHRRDSEWHEQAASAIFGLAQIEAPWAIPWPCLHEFLAVVTNPRIYHPASTGDQAIKQVEIWTESPSLVLIGELKGHWNELKKTIIAGKIAGRMMHDARIAAICIEHGVRELWSADRDFSRMGRITVRNPLTR